MAHLIVTIRSIEDPQLFQEYARPVAPLIERHGGKYVVAEPQPEVKTGEWPYVRTVVVTFPTMADAQRWYQSPEYQKIIPLRLKAITANVVLVRDLNEMPKAA